MSKDVYDQLREMIMHDPEESPTPEEVVAAPAYTHDENGVKYYLIPEEQWDRFVEHYAAAYAGWQKYKQVLKTKRESAKKNKKDPAQP